MSASGKCLCGAVSFAVEFPSNWIAHCHCSMCRRAHGAAFVTWVSVPTPQIRTDDPNGLLNWYPSSTDAERGFCRRCGSTLFFRSSKWPGEWHIALANFIDPLDRSPQVHAYYETHVDWFVPNDDLPKRQGRTTRTQ
jgi:hypothetical protein